MKLLRLAGVHPEHGADRQCRDAGVDAPALCVDVAQPDPGELRVREHAVWNQPTARAARASGQVVPDDPEVVRRHVRELRTPRAFTDGPDMGCTGLQPLVDANEAVSVQLDAGPVEADVGGVRDASSRDQDVATLKRLLTVRVCTARETSFPIDDSFARSRRPPGTGFLGCREAAEAPRRRRHPRRP
jgi:hypothetical protein